MAILKDNRELITVKLPGIDGGEAVVRSGFLAGDIEKINARGGIDSMTGGKMLLYPLVFLIKSWNLTDESGAQLPINEETLGMFTADDIAEIYNVINVGNKQDQDFLAPGAGSTGSDTNSQSV